jgi:hypothetical protein
MKKGANKLTIILVSTIIILLLILSYGVYTGFKVKKEIGRLNSEIVQLTEEKKTINDELGDLQSKYNLLKDDVFTMKKSCLTENACKGRFPGARWYCNVDGDEVNNPSHICVCGDDCKLSAMQIS